MRWTWDQDAVRTVLGLADDVDWFVRVLDLQRQGLAELSLYAAPVGYTEEGVEVVYEQWRDEALADWGTIDITSAGVVALTAVYHQHLGKER